MAENQATTELEEAPAGVSAMIPNTARIMDYLLGGSANFASDRAVGDTAFVNWPGETGGVEGVKVDLHAARDALRRIVQYLAGECGIRQFLDLASGLPTMDNTHLAARSVAPGCRVVYVDNNPSVASHGQYLLASDPDTVFLQADFRDPKDIVARASETLDFTQPVGLILFGVLHFVDDADGPQQLLDDLLAAVPSGSYLALSHFAKDDVDSALNAMLTEMDKQTGDSVFRRTRSEVERFFDGMDVVPPGVVETELWRPQVQGPKPLPMWAGLARKR
ncbi:SAM-dependent methyltransferase [Actinocrinis sp.]|uniref:SAM-dependent methyltransferase n=1 Tax=Actinocrinis sp. TaxID=1920516 RepID=UPI002D624D47|nr:SAM-dependent methyltransferase [Actinocrinis sp.]HZP52175.1 SAM-dependent methyltransferase [Actinocrinis sp.]